MNPENLCRFLDWDSNFFGYRIGRVIPNLLTDTSIKEIEEWATSQQIDCLYFLSDPNDWLTVKLAADYGFQLVDIRLTLALSLQSERVHLPPSDNVEVRAFQPDDIPQLRSLAAVSHRETRFTLDSHFTETQSQLLYETWIENSCNGYAREVLVAQIAGQIVGYVTCHLEGNEGQIGLLAVQDSAQGRGVGSQLISASLRWWQAQGASEVSVVTQGRNIPAQRAYQRAGFLTRSLQLWYHRWSSKEEMLHENPV